MGATRTASGAVYLGEERLDGSPKCDCGSVAEFVVEFRIGAGGEQRGELVLCGDCTDLMLKENGVLSVATVAEVVAAATMPPRGGSLRRGERKLFCGAVASVWERLLANKGQCVTVSQLTGGQIRRTPFRDAVRRMQRKLEQQGLSYRIVACEGGYMLEEL